MQGIILTFEVIRATQLRTYCIVYVQIVRNCETFLQVRTLVLQLSQTLIMGQHTQTHVVQSRDASNVAVVEHIASDGNV